MMSEAMCAGASRFIAERPTGDRQSSPVVCRRYQEDEDHRSQIIHPERRCACHQHEKPCPELDHRQPEFGWGRRLKPAPPKGGPQPCEQRSEEHTSELQSLMRISYAVFCLKKKNHLNIH